MRLRTAVAPDGPPLGHGDPARRDPLAHQRHPTGCHTLANLASARTGGPAGTGRRGAAPCAPSDVAAAGLGGGGPPGCRALASRPPSGTRKSLPYLDLWFAWMSQNGRKFNARIELDTKPE